MSLFGDDYSSPRAAGNNASKSSLFDDGDNSSTKPTASSSMFGDDTSTSESSPWAGFTPKKQSRRGAGVVRSLLADAELPELYVDAWDTLAAGRGQVEAEEVRKVLGESGIDAQEQEAVWRIVTSGGEIERLGRGEFGVLLALVGLAQEGEDLSLDAVDERRGKLPVPSLPQSLVKSAEPPRTPQQAGGGAAKSGERKQSFGFGESDPWASPAMHKGHGHTNGIGSTAAPQRTTSAFSTAAVEPNDGTGGGVYNSQATGSSEPGSSWGASNTYNPGSTGGFGDGAGAGEGGFGGEQPVSRPQVPRNTTSRGAEELITVTLLEEKEGMFLFQHRNYEVSSIRRNTKVIRRYSDFTWLLECLHKRYPFRQLPLLPPKRMAINGNHIAADSLFVEKRRRGLARFANALVRHPVLREEQLVVMFLGVPTVDASLPMSQIHKSRSLTPSRRSSPSGANKPPSPCKKSSSAAPSHQLSRTAYPQICKTPSTPSARASGEAQTCTSTSAT